MLSILDLITVMTIENFIFDEFHYLIIGVTWSSCFIIIFVSAHFSRKTFLRHSRGIFCLIACRTRTCFSRRESVFMARLT